jgi:hypothetical protein
MIVFWLFLFYISIAIVSFSLIHLLINLINHLNKKIKIDYVKDIYSPDNYTVYQRNHFWEKWYPAYSCQKLDDAYKYAKNLSKYIKKHNLPNYL